MAETARKAGFSILGFSSHAPLPFPAPWNLPMDRLADYVDTVRALKNEYAPELLLLVGLEVDFIAGLCGPADGLFSDAGLDYTIGAAHYVLPAGAPQPSASALDGHGDPSFGFTVDEPEEEFSAHLKAFYDGDAEALVDDYYAAVAACARAGGFDILAHFDLVRKNNRGQSLFREDSARYKDAAMAAIDEVAKSGVIVEINTGGMARGKTDAPYPSPWILRELYARNVPVCVNADAHAPGHLTAYRNLGLKVAHEAGYRKLTILDAAGRLEVAMD